MAPVVGSCLKNAFRLLSVAQRYWPSQPIPCGRLAAVGNFFSTIQLFGSTRNIVRAGGTANQSLPSRHSRPWPPVPAVPPRGKAGGLGGSGFFGAAAGRFLGGLLSAAPAPLLS